MTPKYIHAWGQCTPLYCHCTHPDIDRTATASRYCLADAPLTPAEAVARCPEVAALITRAADLRIRLEPVRDDLVFSKRVSLDALGAALAPFIKGLDG